MRNRSLVFLVVGFLLFVSSGSARAQSPEEFQKRRQAIRDAMDPDSVTILRSAQPDGEGAFRQENNLYYLTGINQPGTALILYASRRGGGATPPAGGPPGQGGGRSGAGSGGDGRVRGRTAGRHETAGANRDPLRSA